jgi:hypothetical protein
MLQRTWLDDRCPKRLPMISLQLFAMHSGLKYMLYIHWKLTGIKEIVRSWKPGIRKFWTWRAKRLLAIRCVHCILSPEHDDHSFGISDRRQGLPVDRFELEKSDGGRIVPYSIRVLECRPCETSSDLILLSSMDHISWKPAQGESIHSFSSVWLSCNSVSMTDHTQASAPDFKETIPLWCAH